MRRNNLFWFTRWLCVLLLLLSANYVYADHLKGGWIKYRYIGISGNTLKYEISFYQYSDCSEPEKVDNEIYLGIFDAGTQQSMGIRPVSRTDLDVQEKSDFGPCFKNPPRICYLVAEYTTQITVPANTAGYILSVQRCCRIAGIANVPSSNAYGITYTVTIPGGANNVNNSPVFDFNDATAICYGSPFSFDFSAKDIDDDSLVYSLCSGFTGGTQIDPVVTNPSAPPYQTIPYYAGYSGTTPLGDFAKIDSRTGIFSGVAPTQTGTYVAAVCVDEYRKGVFISHTRKELHLDVSNCKLGGAQLDPSYITCDGYDFTFVNKAGNNPEYTYSWDFGVTSINSDTSSDPQPTYIYGDTGVYSVKLKAQNAAGCQDSAMAEVRIFPGFKTDFSINGSCIVNPYNFTDLTQTKYGYVDSWKWFFGESGGIDDTTKNTAYTYADTGIKTIRLITTNSKGCIDTATKALDVSIGPELGLRFKDTLICNIDTLQLQSFSSTNGAVFKWSPSYNIIGTGLEKPFVYPQKTTTYNVSVTYKGCVTNDSVTVNVIDKVTLNLPADTTICKTDSLEIVPSTNALYFIWSPPGGLSNTSVATPKAAPLTNTTYDLLASVGKCTATDAININVVPYPSANAGNDVSICFGKTAQLNANIEGSAFTWSPPEGLVNPNSLTTVAGPQSTMHYVLSVTDTKGCPKPVTDTVVVNVVPKVIAFAGNDTMIVRQQPLQLDAKGGTNYEWTPSYNLSNPLIANPIAIFTDGPDTLTYSVKVSTPEGCFSRDSIKIYVFNTKPEIFVPNAFTPNSDGLNDVFRATVAGMKQFYYMRIYNRWGQLLFNTGTPNKGWDGTFNGDKQPSGAYVYAIQGIDYNNNIYFKKGTFVLIR